MFTDRQIRAACRIAYPNSTVPIDQPIKDRNNGPIGFVLRMLEAAEREAWQPIATCPNVDGEIVEVWSKDEPDFYVGSDRIIAKSGAAFRWLCGGPPYQHPKFSTGFTHWRYPPPPPPKESSTNDRPRESDAADGMPQQGD